jgi:hypothetical protein
MPRPRPPSLSFPIPRPDSHLSTRAFGVVVALEVACVQGAALAAAPFAGVGAGVGHGDRFLVAVLWVRGEIRGVWWGVFVFDS